MKRSTLEDHKTRMLRLLLHIQENLDGETISQMLKFATEHGLESHGRHHEIYLSDPRRVAPERLKTILRMPVRKVSTAARPSTR